MIDRSGSMSGGKLQCVKEAVSNVVDLMEEKDRASLVVFDDEVQTAVAGSEMTPAFRKKMKAAIDRLGTGGSTNLAGGWAQGCDEIAKHPLTDGINRCLLLSDGQANVGESDPERLAVHTRELARRGITTTTFGVGVDYNESLMEAMANAGSGNYYFIETPRAEPRSLPRGVGWAARGDRAGGGDHPQAARRVQARGAGHLAGGAQSPPAQDRPGGYDRGARAACVRAA